MARIEADARVAASVAAIKETPTMKLNMTWLVESCVAELTSVQQFINESVWHDPERCFEEVRLPAQHKTATVIDIAAEAILAQGLRRRLDAINPLVIGEESIGTGSQRLAQHEGIAILVDAVDGTCLLQHGWDSWCSAITVFTPSNGAILASFVALPAGVCYFATTEGVGKCRRAGERTELASVRGPAVGADPGNASLAFYGYRQGRFDAIAQCLSGKSAIRTPRSEVFTIGGNPGLVRLIDGFKRIDAVIEPYGQAPHDMVPGAFICLQAGASVVDLGGRDLDLGALLTSDLRQRVPFVAAGSRSLAVHLCGQLGQWPGLSGPEAHQTAQSQRAA